LRRARAGHVANGVCFGYRNAPVLDATGRRQHSAQVIEPAEAAVVVRIFTLCAEGAGYKSIAHILNDEGAPAPDPRRPGRRHSWSTSTVRDVLMRETYRGQLTWNRRRRDMRQGRRAVSQRPPSEWVMREAPELRIVSDDLWWRAHDRLAATRATYLAATGGIPFGGRPTNPLESPYLLTGMMACGACGGSMFAHRHGHQEREWVVLVRLHALSHARPRRLQERA
jgi:site-specific DNA recombinase